MSKANKAIKAISAGRVKSGPKVDNLKYGQTYCEADPNNPPLN